MNKSEVRRQDATISIRITREEQARLKAFGAASDPAGFASWAKRTLFKAMDGKGPERLFKVPRHGKELSAFIKQLNLLGNNLNQIAKVANSQRQVDKQARQMLLKIEGEVRLIRSAVISRGDSPL